MPVNHYLEDVPKGPQCRRCREYGHQAKKCPKVAKSVKCVICGETGHSDARCPQKLCTGCGSENSLCFTTYCSNCTKLRNVQCKICFQYGHTDSLCPDLWRRYHLTTTSGPLQQPSDNNLKPKEQRWCSGCAAQGHFEFECQYINRTHVANNPTVHSYEQIYDSNGPDVC